MQHRATFLEAVPGPATKNLSRGATELRTTAEEFGAHPVESRGSIADRLSRRLRLLHYSQRTEDAYANWWRRFAEFGKPVEESGLGPTEASRFLEHLAVERKVSASTQSQALNALVFVFKEILAQPLGELEMTRAKRSKRLPLVLTREEVGRVLADLPRTYGLIGQLLYGSGLRLLECLRLRVKDVEFSYRQLTVRDGKGEKDRVTVLPDSVAEALHEHLGRVKSLHESDRMVMTSARFRNCWATPTSRQP